MVVHVGRRREWLGGWVGGGSLVVVVSDVDLEKFNGLRRTSPCFGVLQSALLGLLLGRFVWHRHDVWLYQDEVWEIGFLVRRARGLGDCI